MGESLEREKSENRIFHVEEYIYNMKISLSELVSLSKIQLLELSMTFCFERKFIAGWNYA